MIGPGAARPGLLAYGYVRLLDHTRERARTGPIETTHGVGTGTGRSLTRRSLSQRRWRDPLQYVRPTPWHWHLVHRSLGHWARDGWHLPGKRRADTSRDMRMRGPICRPVGSERLQVDRRRRPGRGGSAAVKYCTEVGGLARRRSPSGRERVARPSCLLAAEWGTKAKAAHVARDFGRVGGRAKYYGPRASSGREH